MAGAYHVRGNIDFDDISLERIYSLDKANNQSKLANVLFTYRLAPKLDLKDF